MSFFFFILLHPYLCRWLHAPQFGGRDRMQLCGEGAGFWGFQSHTDRFHITKEWSRRRGPDRWGAKGSELRTLLLCLVCLWSQHGLESQRTSQNPRRHYRQPFFLVRAWKHCYSKVIRRELPTCLALVVDMNEYVFCNLPSLLNVWYEGCVICSLCENPLLTLNLIVCSLLCLSWCHESIGTNLCTCTWNTMELTVTTGCWGWCVAVWRSGPSMQGTNRPRPASSPASAPSEPARDSTSEERTTMDRWPTLWRLNRWLRSLIYWGVRIKKLVI